MFLIFGAKLRQFVQSAKLFYGKFVQSVEQILGKSVQNIEQIGRRRIPNIELSKLRIVWQEGKAINKKDKK